jgi:hypothetical protein
LRADARPGPAAGTSGQTSAAAGALVAGGDADPGRAVACNATLDREGTRGKLSTKAAARAIYGYLIAAKMREGRSGACRSVDSGCWCR